ncbi:ABC transporter permease [Dactylosporangium sp. NPDC051484]|uniref:ABC transporter permease n=1 Tax=Dactylosporangium sp. NPDC051484 TaxID=3154942 RepID=UPI00344B4EDB
MLSRVLKLRSGRISVGLLSVILLLAILGPHIAPYDPLAKSDLVFGGSSGAHWFGTDYLGRDLLSRLLAGATISVLGSVEVAIIALVAGAVPGVLSVYLGRTFEWLSLRLIDTLIALPFLVFAVAITALLGNGIPQAMFTVGFLVAPMFYRVTRAATLSVAQSQYVEAAVLAGASVGWVVRKHVLLKVLPPMTATLANAMGTGFIVVASLTFLGIGVQPPDPSWGGVLASDLNYLAYRPWAPLYAIVPILLTVWAFNLLADAIRDVSGASGRVLLADVARPLPKRKVGAA